MPIIRDFYRCGNCDKKQAYVEAHEMSSGGIHYDVHCRGCKCQADYGASWPGGPVHSEWPGAETAALWLINSDRARQGRIRDILQIRQDDEDRAWERLLEVAREVVADRGTREGLARLAAVIEYLESFDELPRPDGMVAIPEQVKAV